MECSFATGMLHPRHRQGVLWFPDMPWVRLEGSGTNSYLQWGQVRLENSAVFVVKEREKGLLFLINPDFGPRIVTEAQFVYLWNGN